MARVRFRVTWGVITCGVNVRLCMYMYAIRGEAVPPATKQGIEPLLFYLLIYLISYPLPPNHHHHTT